MYYFVSDLHLGQAVGSDPREREQLFVRWLDRAAQDASAIYMVGDIFDFWYEYRHVVPRGYTRLLGKLSELTDRGVEIHLYAGNHDLWAFDYLHTECGVKIHTEPYEIIELYGKQLLVGHGDVLGKRNRVQRTLSNTFRSWWAQTLFYVIHPDLAFAFAKGWSGSSRKAKPIKHTFCGENEVIVGFAREMLAWRQERGLSPIDLFVCGHVHCAEIYTLTPESKIAFLGEWMLEPTYGVLTPEGFTLRPYPEK